MKNQELRSSGASDGYKGQVWQRPEGAGEIAVTEADVSKFVADYRAKSLERLQLS